MEQGEESLVYNLSSNAQGDLIAGACENGSVKLFRVEKNELHPVQVLASHKSAVFDVIFADNETIVSGSYDGTVCFWKKEGGAYRLSGSLQVFQGAINALSSQDGKTVFCGCSDGKIRKIEDGAVVGEEAAHRHGVFGISVFKELVVSGGMDGSVKITSAKDLSLIRELREHEGPVRDCKVCPSAYGALMFATCSDDGTVVVYTEENEGEGKESEKDAKEDAVLKRLRTYRIKVGEPCLKLAWSRSGFALGVGCEGGSEKVYVPHGAAQWKESSDILCKK